MTNASISTSVASGVDRTTLPAGRRLMSLLVALGGLWLVMYVIAPFMVENIKPFREYAQTVDETGIIPGALYYTDVPQSQEAEVNNRNAIRFYVNKQ